MMSNERPLTVEQYATWANVYLVLRGEGKYDLIKDLDRLIADLVALPQEDENPAWGIRKTIAYNLQRIIRIGRNERYTI